MGKIKRNLDLKVLKFKRFLDWNKILCNSELSEKTVVMFDFVILGLDLAFNSYCL